MSEARKSILDYTDEEWEALQTQEFELEDRWWEKIEYAEPVIDPYAYIIGMDPGGTTGVACVRIDTLDPTAKPELIYLHQIPDGRYGFKEFFKGSEIGPNLTVISEKWKERNIKGADREPQYIEGGIHMLWGEESVVWQYPDQKELIPDQWLKDNNLWTEGKRHQMDALKHVFAYLRNSGNSATLESLSDKSEGTMAQPGEAEAAQLGEDGSPADMSQMIEALKGIAEAMEAAAEVAGEFSETIADGLTEGDGEAEPIGSGGNGGPGGFGDSPPDERKRHRREVNGAFAGYFPADEEVENSSVLFED